MFLAKREKVSSFYKKQFLGTLIYAVDSLRMMTSDIFKLFILKDFVLNFNYKINIDKYIVSVASHSTAFDTKKFSFLLNH